MRDFVKHLMNRFDSNGDGRISFEELSNGVRSLGIILTSAERQSLMKKFDANLDGEISTEELLKILSGTNTKLSKSELATSVDQILRKIASGADKFASLKEYTQNIVTRFDKNRDGYISFDELC
jgi:Ca2+-binding EF-hand superfamily protein